MQHNISKTEDNKNKINIYTRAWSIKQGNTVLKFQKIFKFIFSSKESFTKVEPAHFYSRIKAEHYL